MKYWSSKQWIIRTAEQLLFLGKLHPQIRAELANMEVTEDIAYTTNGNRLHKLDIWRKKTPASSPRPAVFLVHGGGFHTMSRRTHWWFAYNFAQKGYVVVTVDYRLAPESPFPAAIEDICAAYQWVINNASPWNIDPRNVALAGESAGANLILSLTLANCFAELADDYAQETFRLDCPPRAVLPISGFLQVTSPERFANRPMNPVFRNRIYAISRQYAGVNPVYSPLLDPVLFLETTPVPSRPLPPMYLAVGTKDPIEDDTLRLATALKKMTVQHELELYDDEPHGFHALGWRPAARQCWDAQYQFLEQHLVLSN